MKQREGELERAKAIDALRRSILEAKEELRFELINLEKKQRVKERKEMMKQVEISRSRNTVSYTHLTLPTNREV